MYKPLLKADKKDRRQVNLKIVNCGGAYRDCIKGKRGGREGGRGGGRERGGRKWGKGWEGCKFGTHTQ